MVNTDYKNVYTAKREYDDNSVGYKLRTESGEYIGTLSDINNNRSNNGEQIFTYTKTENGRGAMPLEASADYLKEIMEKYPNAKINTKMGQALSMR